MQTLLPALVGFAAGCIGLYSFMPQVVKCCRTGETAAISLRMFAIRSFGLLLWTVYGFALGSLPVLVFSALGLMLSLVVLVLKVRGSRSQPADEGCPPDRQTLRDAGTAEPVVRPVPDRVAAPPRFADRLPDHPAARHRSAHVRHDADTSAAADERAGFPLSQTCGSQRPMR
jgi:MtN3 and saliva related transmembrane protein